MEADAPRRRPSAEATMDEDFAKLGRQLLAQAPGRFDNLNPIWQHPDTGAVLYVGAEAAAGSRELLSKLRIKKIVFCQDEDEGRRYFEGEPEFEYFRFNIGKHRGDPLAKQDALAYFTPYFEFVEHQLGTGNSVLVHCLAGAHRAGTAGVACLMRFCDLNVDQAVQEARRRRPAINPIGGFPALLKRLEECGVRGSARWPEPEREESLGKD